MCQVCCDNLELIYQDAGKSTLGVTLQMNDKVGQSAIEDVITNTNQIDECKLECHKLYPLELPKPKPLVENDPTLGTEQFPGASCSDIKRWGP